MSHPFDRYSSFTDLAALKSASELPLRKSMRVNTLKCSIQEFLSWAKAKSWQIEEVPWCPKGFFVDRENRDEALGKDLLHVLGYVYMQEAASMLPVALLDPKPGETVLDMSAAPGSKATQIAARMNGKGTLIVSDVQEKRLWALLTNLQRCGDMNVIVVRKVGQWFAGNMTERFDRVLCDAPCTAQGTVRKDTTALQYCSTDNIGKMAKLQRELLEAAVHAAKVGGRIVYSTCTLTPEENEGVILSILHKFGDALVVVDPSNDAVESAKWKVQSAIEASEKVQHSLKKNFPLSTHSGLRASPRARASEPRAGPRTAFNFPLLRLWPQTYDTEGFFSAVFEKRAPTKAPRHAEEVHRPDLIPKARMREMADRLEDWYGTSFLDDDEILLTIRDQICVLTKEAAELRLPATPYWLGLPFGKFTDHGLPRLSHEMATLRGRRAKKQVLRLTEADMKSSMRGTNIGSSVEGFDDGDVLLALEENPLGRPMIFGRGMLKKGTVLNRLPREMVKMFT